MPEETIQGLGSVEMSAPPVDEAKPKDTLAEGLGTPAGEWQKIIPDALKNEIDWSKYKSIDAVLKSHVESEKYRGRSISLPGEGATDEDYTKLFSKLRPASADDYELELPTYDGKVEWHKETLDWVKKSAHECGLHPQQAQKFLNAYGERVAEQSTNMDQNAQAQLVELRKDFGSTWDLSIARANQALEHLGGNELLEAVKGSNLATDPTFLRAMFKLGQEMADDDVIVGEVHGVMTPSGAAERIREINADRNHAYHTDTHPDHKAAVEEMAGLYRLKANAKS